MAAAMRASAELHGCCAELHGCSPTRMCENLLKEPWSQLGIWQRCGRSLGLSLSPSPRKHSTLMKAVNTAKSFSALYTKLRFNDVWM